MSGARAAQEPPATAAARHTSGVELDAHATPAQSDAGIGTVRILSVLGASLTA